MRPEWCKNFSNPQPEKKNQQQVKFGDMDEEMVNVTHYIAAD